MKLKGKVRLSKGLNAKVSFFKIIVCVVLILYSASLIILFLWGLLSSLKTVDEFRLNLYGLPNEWAFSNYSTVLSKFFVRVNTATGFPIEIGIGEQLLYSLMYVGGCAILQTLIPCLMAYLSVKFPYKFSKAVYVVVIIAMVLPVVGSQASEIRILRLFNLYDTLPGIWLLKANFIGMYYLIFYAAFQGVANDYAEAARIDGAGEFRVMVQIMFPMVRTICFTVFLILAVQFWNDYQAPLLYMPSHPTLATGMYLFSISPDNELSSTPMRMAGCFMLMLPILIVFIIFKEKMMSNVSFGGLKE